MRTMDMQESVAGASGTQRTAAPLKLERRMRRAGVITTALFAVMMTASGVAFLAGAPPVTEGIHRHLGYPGYFVPLLGLAKLLGVATLVAPRARTLREWAYAGFTFLLIAAILSHTFSGDVPTHAAPAAFSLGLLLASYFLRRRRAAAGPQVRRLATPSPGAGRFWRLAPWLSRLALLPVVVIFTAVSARYLANPVDTFAGLGASLSTPQAITTARIGFGAFPLAFALFLAACLLSTRRLLVGLVLALTVAASAAVIRAVGISIDGTAAESLELLRAELGLLVLLVAGVAIELNRRRHARDAPAGRSELVA